MNRLTDGISRRLILGNQYATELFNKLHTLENIEEDLKIELNILFQALNKTQPIFVKDSKNSIVELDQFIITHRVISKWQLILSDGYSYEAMYLNLSDYGKTWALSREELL